MFTKLEKYHSLIFTIISLIGFEIITYAYNSNGLDGFYPTTIAFLLIFICEAFLSFQYAQSMQNKLPLPHIVNDIKHIHISQHIILPLLLYVGISGFIFFNGITLFTEVIILLSGITLFSIFEGQRTSFRNEFSFDESLHYVYDSIKIIIYFLGIDLIISASRFYSLGSLFAFTGTEVIAFTLFLLILVRKRQFNTIGIIYIFIASLILAGISIIPFTLTAVLIAIISTIFFYLLVGIIHHKLNATLTFGVIAEYLVIALITILALRGNLL